MEKTEKEPFLMVLKSNQTSINTTLIGTYTQPAVGTGIFTINYVTPSTNHPVDAGKLGYSQYLCLWVVTTMADIYNQAPDQYYLIEDNSSCGQVPLEVTERLNDKTYVVGYCYGKPTYERGATNVPVGAVTVFEPDENQGDSFTPELNFISIEGSTVLCSYKTPTGNNPYDSHNWFGIAQGSAVWNDGKQTWMKTSLCNYTKTSPAGVASLSNVSLVVGNTYTFAFGYAPIVHVDGLGNKTFSAGAPTVGMYCTFTVSQG